MFTKIIINKDYNTNKGGNNHLKIQKRSKFQSKKEFKNINQNIAYIVVNPITFFVNDIDFFIILIIII